MPLPTGVVIDININLNNQNPYNPNYPNNPPFMQSSPISYVNTLPIQYVFPPPATVPTGAYVDVLFAPSGAILTTGGSSTAPWLTQATMNFWVRQPDSNNPSIFAGTPTVIAVFAQTGLTGSFAPVPNVLNPTVNPYMDIQ